MIRIGEVQDLQIVKRTDFGVYVGDEQERVLLPRKQVPENAGIGDTVTVFIYRDSQDRLLATTRKPMACSWTGRKTRGEGYRQDWCIS